MNSLSITNRASNNELAMENPSSTLDDDAQRGGQTTATNCPHGVALFDHSKKKHLLDADWLPSLPRDPSPPSSCILEFGQHLTRFLMNWFP